jgi:molybdopterin synthase catalytic subunit
MPITVRLFASLREHKGQDRLILEPGAEETVAGLFDRLFADRPRPDWPGPLLFAVNREYVDGAYVLRDGDEIAFIPPLGGGVPDLRVQLTDGPLELAPLLRRVEGPGRGGVCVFTGTVRDTFEDRPVLHLEYEAYAPMALSEMSALCDRIEARWPDVAVAIAHRIGRLEIGDAAVHVVCAAAHRGAAFEACRFGIDQLKETVPIFKKEVYEGGSSWKANSDG